MFGIGKRYKFELDTNIFYTGIVVDEDITSVKINTIRNETLILNKENIRQAKEVGE